MKKLIISIDVDGCLVVDRYPSLGLLMDHATIINKWYDQGHTIIINTCRTGHFEDDVRDFLALSGIKYHYMNENAPERIEMYGGDSRKISCDVHFDDKCAYGFMGWRKADCYVQYLAHRKPVIICIVGESGSGKTFLAEYIERNFGVKAIQSWTTRPRRTPCESGHEFITNEEFNKFKRSEMIAHTKFGEHRYCCLKSDVLEENTYVLDEFGLSHLRDNYSDDYDIYSIRVRCNKKERIERAGQERVDRDEDKFKMPSILFDHLWFTDSWRCESLNRSRDYDKLHNFVNRCLNRGWQ